MNHQEIIRRWIEQVKHGRTGLVEYSGYGNITFCADTIYSYGHWPMACIIDYDKKIALYRNYGYSVSTSAHQGIVWSALYCHGFKIFNVPNVRCYSDTHDKNFAAYEDEIDGLLNKADRAYLNRKYYMKQADDKIKEMYEYIEYFKL